MDKKEKVTHFNIGTLEAGAGRHPDLYKGVKLVSFSFSDKLLSEEEMKSLTEPDATSLGKEL
jgi:hypothetical protein